MMLGFKRRFAPYVLDGSKTHTIRGLRKDGKTAKPGETLHCYVDPRQKSMLLLGRWECVRVEMTEFYTRADGTVALFLEKESLSLEEKNLLAYRDGFRSDDPFLEMMRYWMGTRGKIIGICVTKKCKPLEPRVVRGEIAFVGHLTHWRFDERTRNPEWQ
jgi:hypothetical protein